MLVENYSNSRQGVPRDILATSGGRVPRAGVGVSWKGNGMVLGKGVLDVE